MTQTAIRPPFEPRTRIQRERVHTILDAALDVFSVEGFGAATLDRIAEVARLSKPNLLYYFSSKEAIHRALIARLLDNWLAPLKAMDGAGDPLAEIRAYMRRKLELARDYPRESRLFANEILRGAPHIEAEFAQLRALVDEKVAVMERWMEEGRMARVDARHLIFSIWATTQHYADFDVQVRAVLGPGRDGEGRFDDAARTLDRLYLDGLRVR